MCNSNDLLKVGIFTNKFNKILGTDIKDLEIFRSKGLPAHMVNSKHDYFEVGNGSRRTLQRVPEMMDTPPIRNNCAFIFTIKTIISGDLSTRISPFYCTQNDLI